MRLLGRFSTNFASFFAARVGPYSGALHPHRIVKRKQRDAGVKPWEYNEIKSIIIFNVIKIILRKLLYVRFSLNRKL